MTDGEVSAYEGRPVDARIAADWRAFFQRGEVFALAVARPALLRRIRGNTRALTAIVAVAVAAIAVCLWLVAVDMGRAGTFVLLGLVVLLAAAAFAKILGIRRLLTVARDSPEEYVAVFREGFRFAGVEFLWADVPGGLSIYEREDTHAGLKRLTAAFMIGAGYSRCQLHFGVREGTIREYRDRAPDAVRPAFFVTGRNGGVRIPLEWAVDDESINVFTTAVRVSAADADVPIVVSRDPKVIHSTLMAIWHGRRPGSAAGGPHRAGGTTSTEGQR